MNRLTESFLREAGRRWARAGSPLDMSGVQLPGVYLINTDLSEVWMPNANLTDAKFFRAILTRASFSKTTLIGADLTRADLAWATFVDAALTGADLRGVKGLTAEQRQMATGQGATLDEPAPPL